MSAATGSVPAAGPMYTSILHKLTTALTPTNLEIIDDSHLHASHAAMKAQGGLNKETHFRVSVVSPSFEGKPVVQRHRMIYDLLSEELKASFSRLLAQLVGGLHALSLNTKTPKEVEKLSNNP
ncbi:hypothetical protein SmJEL517_g00130 [Synchytrium microbalum]|uniref:BolA protein n=1 Tax=Synchytrium microbalum TaxID=1806994 RepID=A0A507CFP1_9FUNG|nr:uncharacterized protein SmJEL517_g00130 [Synchytrium microbalum]TPX38311.1 hypothetical protein SmJEL517_g00130 [Synchytrium microbalum]